MIQCRVPIYLYTYIPIYLCTYVPMVPWYLGTTAQMSIYSSASKNKNATEFRGDGPTNFLYILTSSLSVIVSYLVYSSSIVLVRLRVLTRLILHTPRRAARPEQKKYRIRFPETNSRPEIIQGRPTSLLTRGAHHDSLEAWTRRVFKAAQRIAAT